MAVLILADHDGIAVTQPTRSAVAAATKLGDVTVLVFGPRAAADAAVDRLRRVTGCGAAW